MSPTPRRRSRRPYTIAFDANGGKWGTGTVQTPVQTNPDGTAAWPEEPVRAGYYLDGWYDAPEGGNQITADHVFTADGTIYAQWLSTAFAWKWDEATKTLTFSGQTSMPYYSYGSTDGIDGRPWKDHIGEAKNVVIKDGIKSVGSCALWNSATLESVTIPDSVTNIKGDAFHGCRSLTSVTIPEGVTSIEHSAFSDCSSLASVTIPEGVTSIGREAFDSCTNLTAINFTGTVAQWTTITKETNAIPSKVTTIHCSDGDTAP